MIFMWHEKTLDINMSEYKVLILWIPYFLLGQIAQANDICVDESYRTVSLYGGQRDVNYSPGIGDPFICDFDLNPANWTRLGTDNEIIDTFFKLPEHCINKFRCGAEHPIWLKGAHPTGNEPIEAVACVSSFTGNNDPALCCDAEIYIEIKKCDTSSRGLFYLYRIPATPFCSATYCSVAQSTETNPEEVFNSTTSSSNSEEITNSRATTTESSVATNQPTITTSLQGSLISTFGYYRLNEACPSFVGGYVAIAVLSTLLIISGAGNVLLYFRHSRRGNETKDSSYTEAVKKNDEDRVYQQPRTNSSSKQNLYRIPGKDEQVETVYDAIAESESDYAYVKDKYSSTEKSKRVAID